MIHCKASPIQPPPWSLARWVVAPGFCFFLNVFARAGSLASGCYFSCHFFKTTMNPNRMRSFFVPTAAIRQALGSRDDFLQPGDTMGGQKNSRRNTLGVEFFVISGGFRDPALKVCSAIMSNICVCLLRSFPSFFNDVKLVLRSLKTGI